jgi:tetratricopeptide (TPR) repeat protein
VTTNSAPSGSRRPESILEQLWQDGRPPSIRSFVATLGSLDNERLLAVLRVDQRNRWANGQRVDVRSYLREFPALADDSEALFELIYHEWLIREELGESLSPDEYVAAFPDLAERLRLQLDVHQAFACEGLDLDPDEKFGIDGDETILEQAPLPDAEETTPRVPGYEILGELGRGGMGIVYRALQLKPRRAVALKMILAGRFASNQDRLLFLNEAQAVAVLDHPNIVPILELNQHQGQHFFSMRLIEGGTLADRLEVLRDDPRAAARLMVEIAGAVHHAHQRGVLHRDLKPANILLDEQDRPYVTDFGLAKRTQADGDPARTGWVVGSPGYMAPEQACGDAKKITTATDVYGLGAILYTLLTGRPPFDGGSAQETFNQLRDRAPEPPSRFNPKAPQSLEVICLKCLEKDPARRYASTQALAADLQLWLAGKPITARPVRLWEHAWLWARRSPAQAALALALAVACIAGLAGVGTQWYRAEANLRDARAAETSERTARLAAQARFALALDAARECYAIVRENLWLKESDLDGSRHKLLSHAGEYYKKLEASLRDDPTPKARSQLAAAYLELGSVMLESKTETSTLEAASAFDQAVAIRRERIAHAPDDLQRQMDLAITLLCRGLSERGSSLLDESERSYAAACVILERLSTDPVQREEALNQLSWCLGNMAALMLTRGRHQDALPLHQRVLEIRERLRSERPNSLNYKLDHAWTLLDLAIAHRVLGRLDLAAATAQQATEEFRSILVQSPNNMDAMTRLVVCLDFVAISLGMQDKKDAMIRASEDALTLGETLDRLSGNDPRRVQSLADLCATHSRRQTWIRDLAGARRSRLRAIALYQGLARTYPGAVRIQLALARCLLYEAEVPFQRGKNAHQEKEITAALACSEQALELYLPQLRRAPTDESLAASVIESLQVHALLLLRNGRRAEAVAVVERAKLIMAPLTRAPGFLHYDFACLHLLLGTPEDRSAREPHAIELLRKAISAGFRDVRLMRNDADLAPLRNRADFQTLLMDMSFPADPFQR